MMKYTLYRTRAFCLAVFVLFIVTAAYADFTPDYEVTMSRGISKIDSREYDEAISAFREVLKTNPGDTQAMLMLGIAQNRKGMLTDAEITLKDVANRQYDLSRTYYELGVVYYKQGNYSASREYFKRAEQKSPEPSLNKSIAGFNTDLERRDNTKRFNFQATVGLQYDSNVTLRSSEDDPFIANHSDQFGNHSNQKADARAILFLRGTALITDTPVRTTAAYSFYQSLHSNLSSYNVQNHEVELKASYSPTNKVTLETQYLFDYTFLGSEDFSKTHTFRPSVRLMLLNNMPTTLVYGYAIKNYFDIDRADNNSERSGFNTMVGIEQKITVTNNFFLTLSYYYDNNNARDGLASYVGNKYALAAYYDYRSIWAMGAKFEYYHKNYAGSDIWVYEPDEHWNHPYNLVKWNVKRNDIMRTFNVFLVRPITPLLSVSIDQTFIVNSSSNASFAYDRSITGIFLTARF
jgi:tetratricopeptide (TPR) repeat protein